MTHASPPTRRAAARSAAAQTLGPSANRPTRRAVKTGRLATERQRAVSVARLASTSERAVDAHPSPAGQPALPAARPDHVSVSTDSDASADGPGSQVPSATEGHTAGAGDTDALGDAGDASDMVDGLRRTDAAGLTDARSGSRQFNAHDADRLMAENNQLLSTIAALGERSGTPFPNVALLQAGAQASAVCQYLIEKQLISEAELGVRVMLQMRGVLTALLQQYEEQAAKAPKPPARGGLIVPGRR